MLKRIQVILFPLLLVLAVGCSEDEAGNNPSIDVNDPEITIWTGPTVTFEKINDADPTNAQNQDRLTDNVWITRGNNGGQIFNAKTESSANKAASPRGTLWALGTTNNLSNLNFQLFRTAVSSPKDVEGKNLVLFLESEKILVDVRFTSWSQSKGGGFIYERSSAN